MSMKKILLIDDSVFSRDTITDLLEVENYEVLKAGSGLAGLRLARNEYPDLILCDVVLPDLSGYEVLQALRYSPKTSSIPLVFVSALVTPAEILQGLRLGAEAYVTKPFTIDELLGTIGASLN